MRIRRTAAFAATMILCVASFSARAGDARFEVDLLVGAAFPSHHPGETLSSVDPYGTTTSNALRSEAKTGLSYGARVRYVGSSGLGIELLYERARLDLDSTTRYDLAWDSVVGPRSESYRFTGSGTLEIDPLSLNLLYRADVLPWMGLMVSGGITYEKLDLDDRSTVGLVSYIGDSIETFAAETRELKSSSRTTWNAGLDLDFRITGRASIFFDGRYYGNAGGTIDSRRVLPGSYAGLHLGGTVPIDTQEAARYDEQLRGSSHTTDVDTKLIRAAVGLRFRF